MAWLKKNQIHILVWTLFILYETVIVGLLFNIFSRPLTYALHYLIIICFFYLHAQWIFPWLVSRTKNALLYIPIVFGFEILGYIVLHYLCDLLLMEIGAVKLIDYPLNASFAFRNLYRCLYFLGFSTGYYYLEHYLKEKRKTDQLEKERLQAVIREHQVERELARSHNALLQAQINPHFLFNTLDFVYSDIGEKSPRAGEAIICLSQMMRYALEADQGNGFISLKEELFQAESLIQLHRLKSDREINIYLSCTQQAKKIQIIPLVLLTLLENIFKHGYLDSIAHIATINMTVIENVFYLETCNAINDQRHVFSMGSGLDNLRQRLEFAYGPRQVFNYGSDQNGQFKTSLSLVSLDLNGLCWTEDPSIGIDTRLPHEGVGYFEKAD